MNKMYVCIKFANKYVCMYDKIKPRLTRNNRHKSYSVLYAFNEFREMRMDDTCRRIYVERKELYRTMPNIIKIFTPPHSKNLFC